MQITQVTFADTHLGDRDFVPTNTVTGILKAIYSMLGGMAIYKDKAAQAECVTITIELLQDMLTELQETA